MNSFLFNKPFSLLLLSFLIVKGATSQQFSDSHISIYLNSSNIENAGDTSTLYFTIDKKNITGFAKFELAASQAISFTPFELPNSAINIQENSIKILWVDLPNTSAFTIKVPVKAESNSDSYLLTGTFSYILNKQIKKLPIDNISLSKAFVVNVPETPNAISDSEVQTQTQTHNTTEAPLTLAVNNTKTDYYISDLTGKTGKFPKRSKNLRSFPVTHDSIFNNSVAFFVQIAAFRTRIFQRKLNDIYSGEEPITEEFHNDGWYKYTIGHFNTYEAAQKLKLACGVKDAFITARSAGKSIHILEAIQASISRKENTEQYYYAIQIAALSKYINNSKLRRLYNIDHIVAMENAANLYKYTVGNFRSYTSAELFKQELAIPDAFIVAYKNGKRVDVQSAKKITD